MDGGYDSGYSACQCFWGSEPGSYVKLMCQHVPSLERLKVLDAGCGEGKNAVFLASRGAVVEAIDVSELAIENGRRFWESASQVQWRCEDIRRVPLRHQYYDVVVAYGLLHCFPSTKGVRKVLARIQEATCTSGYNVICAFNDRYQELDAHPRFTPSLLSHADYLNSYSVGWEVIAESDTDLSEQHPHNNIQHTHSMTRILARKL